MHTPHRRRHITAFALGGMCALGGWSIAAFMDQSNQSYGVHSKPQVRYVRAEESWNAQLPLTQSHVSTPDQVRALYLSGWTTGIQKRRTALINAIVTSNNLNSVVIDIKDATGRVTYTGSDSALKALGVYSQKISSLRTAVRDFHKHGIYVIGRISAFEDPYIVQQKPEWGLRSSDGLPWHDYKGNHKWVDPSNTEYHDYIVALAQEAYRLGIDEINIDYVRYPSEGPTSDILIPDNSTKRREITKFFKTLDVKLRAEGGIPLSADVFGLTTTAQGSDIGIGQVWEDILPHVDYLAPMIYPSHYAPGSFGFDNPAEYPYEVVFKAIEGAITKTTALGEPITKIRPWIQDFDLGAQYGEPEVKAQIQALEKLGIQSWLSWDPANQYTQAGYVLPDTD